MSCISCGADLRVTRDGFEAIARGIVGAEVGHHCETCDITWVGKDVDPLRGPNGAAPICPYCQKILVIEPAKYVRVTP
jgi:hypothetical protein